MRNRNFTFRAIIIILSLIPILIAGPAICGADEYPIKPIKLYVPYGAGGSTDIAARMLVSVIPDFLGQPVVVVNKPGAAGSICFDYIRKSKTDGYTMMMNSIGATILYAAMNPKLPFRYDEHTYVARTQILSNSVVVNPKSPWKSFKDLAASLKKTPGKYKFSTAGVGTTQHLGGVVILKELGVPLSAVIPVHYDSSAAAILALIQGEVDFCLNNFPATGSHLKAGKLRGLAVTTPERIKDYPDIPTFTESGYPAIDVISWIGVGGPPGLPDDIVKKWEVAVEKSCKTKPWMKMVKNMQVTPSYLNHDQFTKFAHKEFKRYRTLYSELGLLKK